MALSFSIVTPTLNRRDMLVAACESVRSQNWSGIQHIVADGGSKDETEAALARFPDVLFLPGPDRGIYDGLNRALAAADGDIVGWLNSDDAYAPQALARVASAFQASPNAEAVCGGAAIEDEDGSSRIYPGSVVADLSPAAILIGPTLPNAWFFRRSALVAGGGFDTALRFAADADFMMRWAGRRPQYAHVESIVYRYRRHAGSATLRQAGAAADALRLDMLQLARRWRASDERSTRAAAIALEGRCRAGLAASRLSRGDVIGAVAQGAAPFSVARGMIDYAYRWLHPRARLRRAGAPG